MFNTPRVVACLKGLVGWKNHYDPTEIPDLTPTLNESETGEFYNYGKHPAVRLDLIKNTIPQNKNLEVYLNEITEGSIIELLNEVSEIKKVKQVGKELLSNDVIQNAEGWIADTIINQSRFVGIRFIPALSIGLKAQINRLGLQLTQAQTGLDIYLYHSSKLEPIKIFQFVSAQGGQFNWKRIDWEMFADDEDLSGGEFYMGYYQDDLIGQAINYDKLNWETGYCSTCDGGGKQHAYLSITKYVKMDSFYVPNANLDPSRNMFNPNAVIASNNYNWGFNLNISALCDLTNFWCDNRKVLKDALVLKVTYKLLRDIQFSNRINYVEEQIKMMIIRDLEGDKETRLSSIPQRYERALKAVIFDQGGINSICLPPAINSGITYSAH